MSERRGGKRKGAGRKPGRGERKTGRNVRLTPTLWEYLDSREDSAAEQIETTMRRTAAFKAWMKTQPDS